MALKDMTGVRTGRLTVIGRTNKPENTKDKKAWWLCKCDCGNIKIVNGYRLRNGQTKSCGCLAREVESENGKKRAGKAVTHGLSHKSIYSSYKGMINRCTNPNAAKYKNYGGRGISVCKEWADSITAFYDWAIANGYEEGLTIDRIDVNGNYTPDNCRWVTKFEQASNKRNNRFINDNGEMLTASQFARKYGLTKACVWERCKRGWDANRMKQKSRRRQDNGNNDQRLLQASATDN